jgi:cell division protein FtsB
MASDQHHQNQEVERLQSIYQAIKELRAEKAALEEENKTLKAENHGLRTQIQSLKTQVKEIEDKNVNLQAAKALSSQQFDHQMVRSKIDHFVEEIDRCLAMLKTHGGVQ